MNAQQIILPFRRRSVTRANASRDLIGCSYDQDEHTTITVIDICADNPARVVVQRDDRKMWTMPGWLVRLILLEESKRAA